MVPSGNLRGSSFSVLSCFFFFSNKRRVSWWRSRQAVCLQSEGNTGKCETKPKCTYRLHPTIPLARRWREMMLKTDLRAKWEYLLGVYLHLENASSVSSGRCEERSQRGLHTTQWWSWKCRSSGTSSPASTKPTRSMRFPRVISYPPCRAFPLWTKTSPRQTW